MELRRSRTSYFRILLNLLIKLQTDDQIDSQIAHRSVTTIHRVEFVTYLQPFPGMPSGSEMSDYHRIRLCGESRMTERWKNEQTKEGQFPSNSSHPSSIDSLSALLSHSLASLASRPSPSKLTSD